MENNQNGFSVLLAVIITAAIALAGGYIYLLNKNSLKSYYTDQGIIAVRGTLTGDENCDFTLANEIEAGENNYAYSLRIPEFNKRCEEIKKYSGQRVEIKGHVFGESFSEPCACIPEGYIEKVESIYVLPPQKTAESPISVIDTSNWQTYLNEEWGIEIKYPDSWIVQGNEIHDQDADAYLAISLLANPQNLSFADWWEKSMIVGGRPAALYNSENMEVGGLKAKIAYMPEGEGGWHVHIADGENRIFSLLAKGSEAGNQVFDRMLSSFKFIDVKAPQNVVADKYNIDGMSEFSTVMEGYYMVRDFSFESDANGNPVIAGKTASFVVLNFKDDAFRESRQNAASQKISEDGHYIFSTGLGRGEKIGCSDLYPVDYRNAPLNFKENRLKDSCYRIISGNERYIFNLGSVENGKINCVNYVDNIPCIDDSTSAKITNSTFQKPVKIELFFGQRDYPVMNQAYKVKIAN